MGHLNGFWPEEIGILNNSFQKSQMLAPLMGGGMHIRMIPGILKQSRWLDRVEEQL